MIGLANLHISLGAHCSCTERYDSNVSGHSNSVRRDFRGISPTVEFSVLGSRLQSVNHAHASIIVGVLSDNMIEYDLVASQ
jgi:hypothetical protein